MNIIRPFAGGGLLLRELEQKLGLIERVARCFTDHRHPSFVEHGLKDLTSWRR